MAKLIIPRSNEREKAMFAKLNITLIEAIAEKDFEAVIIDYLNKHNVLHLATCRDSEPRSTPLEYFNNGLTVHVLSEGGGKFANLTGGRGSLDRRQAFISGKLLWFMPQPVSAGLC